MTESELRKITDIHEELSWLDSIHTMLKGLAEVESTNIKALVDSTVEEVYNFHDNELVKNFMDFINSERKRVNMKWSNITVGGFEDDNTGSH